MASICRESTVGAAPDVVWAAVRDVGAAHRLFPGVLRDARLEGGDRIVTFANGLTVRERIVDLNDARRRLAYAAIGERLTHHHGSIQVCDGEHGSSRVIWTTDLLPHVMVEPVGALIEQAISAMRGVLERSSSP